MADLRVHVFAIGDPYNINTWSNVPYFFLRALQKEGVEVQGFNVIPEQWLSYRLTRFLVKQGSRLRHRFGSLVHEPTFFRNRLISRLVHRNIRNLSTRSPEADVNLFLTFSFSSFKYIRTPVIHYCDRTYEHFLKEIGRRPKRTDRRIFESERVNVKHAALVLTLNEPCRNFIRNQYRGENVHRLKAGINIEAMEERDPQALIATKEDSKHILFIGRDVQKRGVDILVSAFRIFNAENGNDFKLHVVGVTRDELKDWHERIELYPYLRKDDPTDLSIYNNLLASARLFVVPMRWGPLPSVIREAHWACTPVIISKVSNASERVRHEKDGILVDSLKPEDFAFQMSRLVKDRVRWREMALEAHRSVYHNTWDETAREFLRIIEEAGITRRRRVV